MRASFDREIDVHLQSCAKTFVAPGRETVRAVNSVDLSVRRGEFVSIVGSNGAGKSTLLGLIAGSLLADEGRVIVRGQDVTSLPSWRRVGLVSRVRQNPQDNMVSSLTIEENFALALAGKRKKFGLRKSSAAMVRRAAREVLEPLGMGLEDRMGAVSGTLSGGQRQAIAVAMASLGSPSAMLLDEHVAALDPNSAARVNEATEKLVREREITTLMVTHDMSHALDHADRLLMMHQGKVVIDVHGTELREVTASGLQKSFASISGSSLPDVTLLTTSMDSNE